PGKREGCFLRPRLSNQGFARASEIRRYSRRADCGDRKVKRAIPCLALMTLIMAACSSSKPALKPDGKPEPKTTIHGLSPKPLTHEEAQTRFKQVAHVTYGLWFGLDQE